MHADVHMHLSDWFFKLDPAQVPDQIGLRTHTSLGCTLFYYRQPSLLSMESEGVLLPAFERVELQRCDERILIHDPISAQLIVGVGKESMSRGHYYLTLLSTSQPAVCSSS